MQGGCERQRRKGAAERRTGHFTLTRLAVSTVCRKSCLNKFCSDGVSILGSNEISGFAFREPLESMAKMRAPPVFEFFSMFSPKLLKSVGMQRQFRGVRLPGQGYSAGRHTSISDDVTSQIGQSAALPHEIVYEDLLPVRGSPGRGVHGDRRCCNAWVSEAVISAVPQVD